MNSLVNTLRLSLVFTVLLAASLVGCEEDLIENPDFINPDTFYQDSDDLVKGVNGVYDNLAEGGQWFNFFYNRYVFEELVGYQVGWEKGPLDFQTGNVSPTDEYISAYWDLSYAAINRANGVIEAAQNMENPSDPGLRDRILAEAKFLRSFYYFNLIRYFDDVPFTTERTTELEFASNEDGKRKILDMMFEDLQSAANVLPSEYTGSDLGRATRWAAKALLMKAYLMDEQWDQARSTAEDIMSNSPHYLFDDFAWNFDTEHENMGERIFEAQVSASVDSDEFTNHHAHFVPPDLPTDMGGVGWHWLDGTKAFRMKYDESDERIPGTFIESYPSTRVDGATVRWSEDADFNLSRFGGVVSNDADPNNPDDLIFGSGFVAKWVEVGISSENNTEKNVPYLRYADVLLGHSEAANESGNGDPYLGINMVRERAGLPELSGLSQEELRDAIVDEFVLEFAFEQKTYPFLKRMSSHGGNKKDYLAEYVNEFINTYDVNRTHGEQDHVLPLPLDEVQSNPNVEQHPFWQ
ncbi:RagB/SusD family nutrient uptake outer membrane protein [Aliifodinibius sp. S!AR15-10]|uniref:RagB/SusD family nutrient uptake outer membrane protein n=1 Tax=Aliifodinibius sp. S!AR15-10 TaxID=2950437 RepID=UPI0028550C69|nr:RagB/SusD family nutrient uptake outer membrane protein [Aliifodinibius sp. S!AR15-10]MDR8389540.1 RagB/SusD family nutrient uptake outer membrane protein [Aliifodinibius sp. S!AR15-10]